MSAQLANNTSIISGKQFYWSFKKEPVREPRSDSYFYALANRYLFFMTAPWYAILFSRLVLAAILHFF